MGEMTVLQKAVNKNERRENSRADLLQLVLPARS